MNGSPAYGLWSLVVLNSAVFLMFAFSFFKPQTTRDWRTFGAFAAFIVALFVEMYGFPLTIYLLSGWLQTRYPGLDLLSHNAGHLWSTLLGDSGLASAVAAKRRCNSASSTRICTRSLASKFDSGSSNRKAAGWRTIARPTATRCRWPPLNSRGRRSNNARICSMSAA